MHLAMMLTGCLLAVIGIAGALFGVRRATPKIRQLERVEDRLAHYSAHVRNLYYGMLAVVMMLCALCVLSGDRAMLMLVLLCALTIFMAFPNVYRMKVDMGLTDEEARQMFGSQYFPETKADGGAASEAAKSQRAGKDD